MSTQSYNNYFSFRSRAGYVVASVMVYCILICRKAGLGEEFGLLFSIAYVASIGAFSFRGIPFLQAAQSRFDGSIPARVWQRIGSGFASLFQLFRFGNVSNVNRTKSVHVPFLKKVKVLIVAVPVSLLVQLLAHHSHAGLRPPIAMLLLSWCILNIGNARCNSPVTTLGLITVIVFSAVVLNDQPLQLLLTAGAVWPHFAYSIYCRRCPVTTAFEATPKEKAGDELAGQSPGKIPGMLRKFKRR